MRTMGESDLELVQTGMAGLAAADVTLQSDEGVRAELLALLTVANQVNAALLVRAAVFDARGLAEVDGFRTGKAWLAAFGRLSPAAASGTVRRGHLLRQLPALCTAAVQGAVSSEHLVKVAQLADKVGVPVVQEADEVLAELAATAGPAETDKACERIHAYVDPDGAEPDPYRDFERRHLSLARQGAMMAIRGQLDPEAGAAVATALDAMMRPPGPDDLRTAGQRRADALADLARAALDRGDLPLVGGQRPHLGVLIDASTLIGHSTMTRTPAAHITPPADDTYDPGDSHNTAMVAREPTEGEPGPQPTTVDAAKSGFATSAAWLVELAAQAAALDLHALQPDTIQLPTTASPTSPPLTAANPTPPLLIPTASRHIAGPPDRQSPSPELPNLTPPPRILAGSGFRTDQQPPPTQPSLPSVVSLAEAIRGAGLPTSQERAWLEWFGELPAEIARRIACDSTVYRALLDPTNGLPLNLGRTYRIAPHWIRKALHARDRGCRWPGCSAPTAWIDIHHLVAWILGGRTDIASLISLCRYHHVRVHEGGWTITFDSRTGRVAVTRPDGRPYELTPTQPFTTATHQRSG